MQRVVSRQAALKVNEFLLLGVPQVTNPAALSSLSWRSSREFKRSSFALQPMDSSVRCLIGNARVLGSLPGHSGRSSIRIGSNVPCCRPASARRSFQESQKLGSRRSRQGSISSRIRSSGGFSPERLLEAAVDVLRNFNEKVNNLFKQGGESGSRDFATAAEEKVLSSTDSAVGEVATSEFVHEVSEQPAGGEFEWHSALWEREVSSAGEAASETGPVELSTEGVISEVSHSNVGDPPLGKAHLEIQVDGTIEETKQNAVGSPELNENVLNTVAVADALSAVETAEVGISQEEEVVKADSLVSSETGEDTLKLNISDVPESALVEDNVAVFVDEIEEGFTATNTAHGKLEFSQIEELVGRSQESSVSSEEIRAAEVSLVVPQSSNLSGLGPDGDITKLNGSVVVAESTVGVGAEERVDESTSEMTSATRDVEHLDNGDGLRMVSVGDRTALDAAEQSQAASGSGLFNLGSDGDISKSSLDAPGHVAVQAMTEEIATGQELDHPNNGDSVRTFQDDEEASCIEIQGLDRIENWDRRTSGHSSLSGLEPSKSRELRQRDFVQDGASVQGEAHILEVKPVSPDEEYEELERERDTVDAEVASEQQMHSGKRGGSDATADLDVQREISRLRSAISHHAYLYHSLGTPVISDAAYDSLLQELTSLETRASKSEPKLNFLSAAEPSPDVLKVVHSLPMLSLASVQKEEDAYLWYQKLALKLGENHEPLRWVVEPKLDGVALSLRYEHGKLQWGATRGNGVQGEDVTHNAQSVLGIPLTIPDKLPGTESPLRVLEVRGEVFMTLKDFEEWNASKMQAGEKPMANPRNAAAGSMRLLSSNAGESRPLNFLAYSIAVLEGEPELETSALVPKTQWDMLRLLKSIGFPVNEDNGLFESFESALEYANTWRSTRGSLKYEADGVVFKVDDLQTQASLGVAGADPRWALAWKFAATEAVSVLEGIELTIGRSGAMIPNARFKPVELGGATISRASLHNFGHVRALGLCEGDHIVIQRAGDVIPHVVQVMEDLRPETAKPWSPPTECPTCGSKLTEISAGAMVFCSNSTCESRHSRQVAHFAKTLISGLGSATLSRLEEELVKDPADFYNLDEESLLRVKGFGKQSSKKLLRAIEESKQQDLSFFIAAVGIPRVGNNTAKELAERFGSFQALLKSDLSGLKGIPGIGAATASCIFDWCQSQPNIELVHRLEVAGCKINGNQLLETPGNPDSNDEEITGQSSITSSGMTKEFEGPPEVQDSQEITNESRQTSDVLKKTQEMPVDVKLPPTTPALSGKAVVITGDFGPLSREHMKKLVALHGGVVRSSVSSKTSFVLCGNRPGPVKVTEASRRGVEMVDFETFMRLTGHTDNDIGN